MSQSAKSVAVAYLARRDYSRQQIHKKLLEKDFEELAIQQALDYCESQGYLDDMRYAQMLIRSHIYKCHGVMRIQQALVQKGLSKDVIKTAIDQCDCDWFELAKQKAVKKYGTPHTKDLKEKNRRIRHLVGQGFSFDQVAYALDYDPYDE
ncbi:regulatory protein RecX [Shewanella gaetbuli]|uniref:Regulatory protein RecX n=1 Tax=Shewanella gaetbuli TaxID=220752 RepID=A0A9X1ZIY6_9GAMM|nr:regulatory protein RecX [Shewanella gaetbuli]MCL1141822.1 recombination regulator RecX [Shewanella gaetbuli]